MDVVDLILVKLFVISIVMEVNLKDLIRIGEIDSVSYFEVFRVFGVVFNKVKDLLVRKSVEVVIKVMLKLMKLDNVYFKKYLVLLVKKLWVFQEKINKLMKIIYEFFEIVYVEDEEVLSFKKKYWYVKNRFFNKCLF